MTTPAEFEAEIYRLQAANRRLAQERDDAEEAARVYRRALLRHILKEKAGDE